MISGNEAGADSTKLKLKLTPKGFLITNTEGDLCLTTES